MTSSKTVNKPITLDSLKEQVSVLSKVSKCDLTFIPSRERRVGKGYAIAMTNGDRLEIGLTRKDAKRTLDAMVNGIALFHVGSSSLKSLPPVIS
jgi:hypothetical protein